MSAFHLVIGNRDKLKFPDRTVAIWELLDGGWQTYLTSLKYATSTGADGANLPPADREAMFDCGAWSYLEEEVPTWTPAQCHGHYDVLAQPGDTVFAPDHMVLPGHDPEEAARRLAITMDNAREFLALHDGRATVPMGVIHGQTIQQRTDNALALLEMGYRHLALGGIARLASAPKRAVATVEAIARLKQQEVFHLHVLGISAPSYWDTWQALGVDSFDGTGPFRAAFFGCYIGPDGREYGVEKDGRANTKKQPPVSDAPACDCLACRTLESYGYTPRTFGSNEHNMGRAVHNVNMYLRRFRQWQAGQAGSVTYQKGLF
jgi:hypothetical protein